MKMLIALLAAVLIISPVALAKQGHMKLLAVKETENLYEGALADLYLEIKPGSGRVFLDTFPLTKADTQISTRFAKQVACDYIDFNCAKYDFFYIIRADSSFIAGPSASAAISLITISLLKDISLNPDVVITGTINSGGIIGPVGAIKEKIDAAGLGKIPTVLIPEGERFWKNESKEDENEAIGSGAGGKGSGAGGKGSGSRGDNKTEEKANATNDTLDLIAYGGEKGIAVIETTDLNDAFLAFTGKKLLDDKGEFSVEPSFLATMQNLADSLCNRTASFVRRFSRDQKLIGNETVLSLGNLSAQAQEAYSQGNYYTAASLCFTANVKGSYLQELGRRNNETALLAKEEALQKNIDRLRESLSTREKRTITDLEAFIITWERITESLDRKQSLAELNATDDFIYQLAYATERVHSAYSWFRFFDHRGKALHLDRESVKASCQNKIMESEERYQYVLLFYPQLDVQATKKEIEHARKDFELEEYELCLFKATQAKAESNVILGVSGIEPEKVKGLVQKKLDAAKRVIAKQAAKGNFPILGYSYYEYSNHLINTDIYSALLFAEYSLEVSNLDMYFKSNGAFFHLPPFGMEQLGYLLVGIALGTVLTALALGKREHGTTKRKSDSNPGSRTRHRGISRK
ncbi:hypothetical protein HYU13_00485 [Candidatus Woesearchaeota archaeon]|nr:hypothetical protein [Candidatus Woesearchaeota archaeon]